MDRSQIETEIGSFISRTFLVEVGEDFEPDTDLFDAGVIDSYGFIDLVSFLEKSFGIKLSDDDLFSPEMSCFSGICGVIADRTGAA